MSELLREVARHLRQTASQHGIPEHCAIVVIALNQDGSATSTFYGEQSAAEAAAQAMPGIAADFVEQLSGAVGFSIPEVSTKLRRPSLTINAERVAAQVIRKARRES